MPWGRRLGSLILAWHQSAGSRMIREALREPSPEQWVLSRGFLPLQPHPSVLGHSWSLLVLWSRSWRERPNCPSQKVRAEAWPPSRAGVNLF